MTLFVSYSSRDGDAVRTFAQHLEQAGHQVWLDQDLHGGDAWWAAILEQIRNCDVFVFALSQDALQSKPCQAELDYARALGVPILPVQIGEVDSYRDDPIFEVQSIDYRNPTVMTGIALTNALRDGAAQRNPLPNPLPDAPAIPFEYLLRLGQAIRADEPISYKDQSAILLELRQALRDEKDETVRKDIRRLLRVLRRRPEVAHLTVNEIDEILAGTGGQQTASPSLPANWYPDPSGVPGRMRYWDGSRWTDHVYGGVQPVNTGPIHQPKPEPKPDPGGIGRSAGEQIAHGGGEPRPPTPGPVPDNYLVWAILSTVLCCLPLGVVAIISAAKVSDLWGQGRYDEAKEAARNAKNFAIWSAVVGVVVYTAYAIFLVGRN